MKHGTVERQELAARLRGETICPGDPGYDGARKVYNAMIDRRPAAIARCADVADVMECVRYARERAVPLAVRSGGHHAAGANQINVQSPAGSGTGVLSIVWTVDGVSSKPFVFVQP